MSEPYFELDIKYEGGYPIGMDPKNNFYQELDQAYRKFLEDWKPDDKSISGLVKHSIGNTCVGLSRLAGFIS